MMPTFNSFNESGISIDLITEIVEITHLKLVLEM